MRRLIDHSRTLRHPADRGAVAVWVALLLVPLLMVAALAIDVGSMNADRQRLQMGADAAALAIAQECADGGTCTEERGYELARPLADANLPLGGTAEVTDVDIVEGWVEVQVESTSTHTFAQVLTDPTARLVARGAASWIPNRILPLAVPECFLEGMPIGQDDPDYLATFYNKFKKQTPPPQAVGCMNLDQGWSTEPGNFGWLAPQPVCFEGIRFEFDLAVGAPGNDETCALDIVRDTRVLLPIFSETNGEGGANARYTIVGYLGFTLTASQQSGNTFGQPGCSGGSERCFTGFVHERFGATPDGRPTAEALATVTSVELRLPTIGEK